MLTVLYKRHASQRFRLLDFRRKTYRVRSELTQWMGRCSTVSDAPRRGPGGSRSWWQLAGSCPVCDGGRSHPSLLYQELSHDRHGNGTFLTNGMQPDTRELIMFYQHEEGIIVVNAGNETVDLSAYCRTASLNSFEEIAPPECRSSFTH